MQYTPGQLRDAVGLSKEAYRHWRRVLTGFPAGKNHGPVFAPGDVLALAVLRLLTDECGLRVGSLGTVSDRIFEVCNETPWEVLGERVLVIDIGKRTCATRGKTEWVVGDNAVVVCPMGPLIERLRDHLVRSSPRSAGRTRARKRARTGALEGRVG